MEKWCSYGSKIFGLTHVIPFEMVLYNVFYNESIVFYVLLAILMTFKFLMSRPMSSQENQMANGTQSLECDNMAI